MILEISKIPGGLRWDNKDRLFTYSIYSSGYDIQGEDLANIELDNRIYVLCSCDSTINSQSFSNISDEIAYIYS